MGRRLQREMLGTRVSITTDDDALGDYLDRLYAAFPKCRGGDVRYRARHASSDAGRFTLTHDGAVIGAADSPEGLVGVLVNHCNRTVAEAAAFVLVHAGAVERDGVAVVLPAQMEAGKTTLTTGLVRAGFPYLTDEAVAIDRDTGTVVPYPKPMTLDRGSWSLFPELEPHEPFATDDYKSTQWQVPPAAIRPEAVGRPSQVGFVVFPRYEEGANTELVAISRAEALVELAKNTFRFDREGRPTLDVLAGVVRGATTYRLPNGDLDEAVACITRLLDGRR